MLGHVIRAFFCWLVDRGRIDDLARRAEAETEKLKFDALYLATRGPIDDFLDGFPKKQR